MSFLHTPIPMKALLALLLGLAAGCGPGADPTNVPGEERGTKADVVVEVVAPADPVLIGEPAPVTVRVHHPQAMRVRFPLWESVRSEGPVERARETTSTRRGPERGRRVTERTWDVLSFALGDHPLFLEGAALSLTGPDGKRMEKPIPADARLRVQSVFEVEDDEKAAPDPSPLRWRRSVPVWLWALPLIAVLAALIGLWARRFRVHFRRPSAEPVPVSPRDKALAGLRRLRERGAIEIGPAEPYYRELSALVRRYLEERFGLRAPERTTEEFIREAAESGRLDDDQRDRVKAFLSECDLVKFARHEPDATGRRSAWNAADRLVRETSEEPGGGS